MTYTQSSRQIVDKSQIISSTSAISITPWQSLNTLLTPPTATY